MVKDMSECDICCDTHSTVRSCATCAYSVCRQCAKRLTIEHQESRGHCPQCLREWTVAELNDRLGKSFYNRSYRAARQTRLLAQHLPLVNAMIPAAEQELRRRQLHKEFVRLSGLVRRERRYDLIDDLRAVHQAIVSVNEHDPMGGGRVAAPLQCAHAGCEGLVLDRETGECAQCRRFTCDRCRCPREANHVCDPDTVASVSAIGALCRPCVRCSAPSVREEGCPVMWCVQCHAFWNWDTGRLIETRYHTPHNPDHREFVAAGRNNLHVPRAREIGDVPCGGLVDAEALHLALLREFYRTLNIHLGSEIIMNATEALHQAQALREQYPVAWHDALSARPLHIAFLVGDIKTRAALGQALERNERTNLLRKDVGEILTTLVFCGADILQRFCHPDTAISCAVTSRSLVELRSQVDGALAIASQVHGRKVQRIDAAWKWTRPYSRQRQ